MNLKIKAWDKMNHRWLLTDEMPLIACCSNSTILELEEDWVEFVLFTGLTDSEGKEIYEGDKCDANHPDCGLFEGYIIYDEEQACFMLRTEICADIYLYEFDEIKIIGNIYEGKDEVRNDKG